MKIFKILILLSVFLYGYEFEKAVGKSDENIKFNITKDNGVIKFDLINNNMSEADLYNTLPEINYGISSMMMYYILTMLCQEVEEVTKNNEVVLFHYYINDHLITRTPVIERNCAFYQFLKLGKWRDLMNDGIIEFYKY